MNVSSKLQTITYHADRTGVSSAMQSKKEGKDQESRQSSITPQHFYTILFPPIYTETKF